MKHVPTVQVLLFVFLFFSHHLNINVATSATKSAELNPNSTPSAPQKKVKRITFNEFIQTAIIGETTLFALEILDDSPECLNFAILTEAERQVVLELNRLGVRIHYSMRRTTFQLKYIKSFTPEDLYVKSDVDNFDETHHVYNLSDPTNHISGTVWDVISGGNRRILMGCLIAAMESNQLMRACLILMKFPEIIEEIPDKTFHKCVFVRTNTRSVFKYIIFPRNPEFFMQKYLEFFRSETPRQNQNVRNSFLTILLEIFADLRIPDGTIQRALDVVLGEANPELLVLIPFTMSRRKNLTITEEKLHSILFGGSDFLNYRVALLKLNISPEALESAMRVAFSLKPARSHVIYKIMSDRQIVEKLSSESILRFVTGCLGHQHAVLFKSKILKPSLDLIFKRKLQHFVVSQVVGFINNANFEALINARTSMHNFPIFSRQNLIQLAAISITCNKYDLYNYLFFKHFILPHDQSPASKKTLLLIAVETKNLDFIKTASMYGIFWDKCRDALKAVENNAEMKELLMSYGAPNPAEIDVIDAVGDTNISTSMAEHKCQSPISSSTAVFSPSVTIISPPVNVESKRKSCPRDRFEVPDVSVTKRPCLVPVEERYSMALESGSEPLMLPILRCINDIAKLKQSRGTNAIVQELLQKGLLSALDLFLNSIVLPEEINSLIIEAIHKNWPYPIKHFLSTSKVNINESIADSNIIGHLFKVRNPELAFELIHAFNFDLKHSDSPKFNPNGDIILHAVWDANIVGALLRLGASPDVKFYHEPSKGLVSLLQWAQVKGKADLVQVLTQKQ